MIDFITAVIGLCVFAFLCCTARATFLLICWRSAPAVVRRSDYSAAQRADDLWGMGTLRPYRLGDGDGARLLSVDVEFADASGRMQRATVNRYASWRWNPSAGFRVWYDPAEPTRATGIGPGYWAIASATLVVALVTFVNAGLQLAH